MHIRHISFCAPDVDKAVQMTSYELGSEDSTGVSSDAFAKPGLSVVAALTLAGIDKAFEASIVTADVLVGDATTVSNLTLTLPVISTVVPPGRQTNLSFRKLFQSGNHAQ
jgi:hypothetical protein